MAGCMACFPCAPFFLLSVLPLDSLNRSIRQMSMAIGLLASCVVSTEHTNISLFRLTSIREQEGERGASIRLRWHLSYLVLPALCFRHRRIDHPTNTAVLYQWPARSILHFGSDVLKSAAVPFAYVGEYFVSTQSRIHAVLHSSSAYAKYNWARSMLHAQIRNVIRKSMLRCRWPCTCHTSISRTARSSS
ncbi:hypothetical protein F5Y01DRAFT_282476 [Xylaria sp. FL0043]|nr:hypothetical protein F5Y01DRAFT_282476 [Xylaria sp. FL0043]